MKISKERSECLALIRQAFGATDVFSTWPEKLLERLLPEARLQRHVRGDLVHSEALGEPEILAVVSGHVMASRVRSDGAHAPIAILGPGLVIGISRGLNPDDDVLHGYRAHDDAVVVHLPASVVFHTLGSDALLWRDIAGVLSRQHRQIFTTVLDQLTGNARQRLAAAISRLVSTYGMDLHTQSLRLRLTQHDLADMLQLTRRSINKEMRALEDMGLVRSEYNGVTVLDMQALRDLGRNAVQVEE
ncbi:Crp/Fnr family transcriptional regulator [Variovorax sp. GB1P17]|uniref:Crp/Fnr family transcriptional regulator n=1 Tax=Variovorax sp. GB1P17 TaxID=3443740 RepID=UPI003F47939C